MRWFRVRLYGLASMTDSLTRRWMDQAQPDDGADTDTSNIPENPEFDFF